MKWIAETLYPMPKRPVESARSRLSMEDRIKFYEMGVSHTTRVRQTAFDLWSGMGVGMETAAVRGTAFGAYNAFAELETYRAGGYDKAAQGLIDGDRARRIRGAFTLAMNADQWQTLDVTAFGFKSPFEEQEELAVVRA